MFAKKVDRNGTAMWGSPVFGNLMKILFTGFCVYVGGAVFCRDAHAGRVLSGIY